MKLIISEQALQDLKEIWHYYGRLNPTRGDNYIDLLKDKFRLLTVSPEMGITRDELLPGLRSLSFRKYIIFYRIKTSELIVTRILSGYRDILSLF